VTITTGTRRREGGRHVFPRDHNTVIGKEESSTTLASRRRKANRVARTHCAGLSESSQAMSTTGETGAGALRCPVRRRFRKLAGCAKATRATARSPTWLIAAASM